MIPALSVPADLSATALDAASPLATYACSPTQLWLVVNWRASSPLDQLDCVAASACPESENAVAQLFADARAEFKTFILDSSDQLASAVAILLLLLSKHQQQLHLCQQQLRNKHGLLLPHNQVLASNSLVDILCLQLVCFLVLSLNFCKN